MSGLEKALQKFDSQQAFADALGVSKQTVSNWKSRGLPAEWVGRVSALAGVSVSDLRPDLFPRVA
jgi:DNA-binding transcriptional regulator YdaS (Cro superfamily)